MAKSNRKKKKFEAPNTLADFDAAISQLGRQLLSIAKRENLLSHKPPADLIPKDASEDRLIDIAIILEEFEWPYFLLHAEEFCKLIIRAHGRRHMFTYFIGNVNVFSEQLSRYGLFDQCAKVMLEYMNAISHINDHKRRSPRPKYMNNKKIDLSDAINILDHVKNTHLKLSNGQTLYNYLYKNWQEDKSSTY